MQKNSKLKEKQNNFVNLIPEFCRKASYRLAAKDGSDEDTRECIEYALAAYSCTIFNVIFGILISIIFGLWKEYLFCLIPILFLRNYAGGAHFNNTPFSYCLTFSIVTILLISYIANIVAAKGLTLNFCIFSVLCGVLLVFVVPRPSCAIRERGEKKKKEFRIKFFITFILIEIINIVLYCFNYKLFSSALSMGVLWVCFMTTDLAYIIIGIIEEKYNKYIE